VRVALAIAGIAIVGVVVVAIVRSDSDDGDESAPEQPASVETADPLPPLPARWGKAANAEAGFALGVPPAWSQKSSGQTVTLKSPGSTAVIRVTGDRSPDAIDSNLDEYAAELLAGLGASGPPAPVGGLEPAEGYELASVSGMGASQGVARERLQVVVVRRPQLAAFPILIASDAGVKPVELDPLVARVVSSLRGRPAG
jgi:hypothetical protein